MSTVTGREQRRRICGGMVFREESGFAREDICILGERIAAREEYHRAEGAEEIIDASGCHVIPGLTDIHFHGCMGSDCCDGTKEAFDTIMRYELSRGVTSVTPATMTVPEEDLARICRTAAGYACPDGADFLGLYMEGPFISPAHKGAQKEECIRRPDADLLERMQSLSGHRIRTVIIAPEMPGAMEFIRNCAGGIRISLGHTGADYETAMDAFSAGAAQLTHMFNAMPPLLHRAPGPIGAAADTDTVMPELICDGIHVHPGAVRSAYRLFGEERIILISDTMRAAGLRDGEYDLGGQRVHVKGREARLDDGTIAGSVTDLMGCMRRVVRDMGIPLHSAVRSAALNPVRAIGMEDRYGSLEPGRIANIVLLEEDLEIRTVIHRGTPCTAASG